MDAPRSALSPGFLLLFPLLLAGCDALFAPADPDADGDGYPASTDCNDALAGVNPGAVELCDEAGLDENCNGLANDADTDQ